MGGQDLSFREKTQKREIAHIIPQWGGPSQHFLPVCRPRRPFGFSRRGNRECVCNGCSFSLSQSPKWQPTKIGSTTAGSSLHCFSLSFKSFIICLSFLADRSSC